MRNAQDNAAHTCSYSCDRPECIKAQRDELAAAAAQEETDEVININGRSGFETHWLAGLAKIGDLLYAAPVTAAPVGDLFVECRQCEECNHAGINDSGDNLAACLACYWSGMAPDEDRCPECGKTGCMSAACPKCGARYKLVASAEFPASTTAAPVIDPSWSLHDRVEFALRDAGFDLDEAAFVAEAASVAKGDLDSPKGGSEAYVTLQRVDVKRLLDGDESSPGYALSRRRIADAMHPQAGDAEVQP